MEENTKNVIGIVISVGVLLVLALVIGLFILNRSGQGPNSPLAFGPTASPSISYPEEWVAPPSPSPAATGDQIVIGIPQASPLSGLYASAAPGGGVSVSVGAPASSGAPQALQGAPSPAPAASRAPAPSAAPRAGATAKVAPSRAPAKAVASPKPAKVSQYWIQAASFTARGKAEDLKSDLSAKGMASLITTKDLGGVTYFRVRIGPYSSQREANGWLPKIRALSGCAEAYVSQTAVLR